MATDKSSSWAFAIPSFGLLLVIWWVITHFGVISTAYLPTPLQVWSEFVSSLEKGTLLTDLGISLARLLGTYVVASILGIGAGVAMGLSPSVSRFFRPILSFFNAISGITWIPFAMLWFGLGNATIAFVIFNSVFFIIAQNTMTGVQTVPEVFEQGMLTMGAGRLRIIWEALLPGALPSIVTGQRLALGFGWRGLIAAEMVAGSVGIGFMIFNGSYDYRPDVVLMGILVVGVVATFMDQLIFAPLERRTIERWGLV